MQVMEYSNWSQKGGFDEVGVCGNAFGGVHLDRRSFR